VNTVLEDLNTGLESPDLVTFIGPIQHEVSANFDGLAQDGHLCKLLLGNELVISPSNHGSQERNVHPGIMIGYKHGWSLSVGAIQQ
jgi:hypothetical protein